MIRPPASLRVPPVMLVLPALAGCWTLDLPEVDGTSQPFAPPVGAPDGWVVEQIEMELTCPDGAPARMALVYPEDADVRVDAQAPALPLALVFHSGPFDFVGEATPADPLGGDSFQEQFTPDKRLTLEWSARRAFSTLGLYPDLDPDERHAGALVAALAAKGIATAVPFNCWGDLWHNRSSVADNDYDEDLFFRDGRTAAEFAFRYLLTDFPPGNPVQMPIVVDPDRVFAVGLGEGARAVGELLAVTEQVNGRSVFPYDLAAAVLDSPVDDFNPYFASSDESSRQIQTGLARIFPGVETKNQGQDFLRWEEHFKFGAVSNVQDLRLGPARLARLGILVSDNDLRIPATANDRLFRKFGATSGTVSGVDVWIHRPVVPAHVLSNRDVVLAKAVADFLGEGTPALDPELLD